MISEKLKGLGYTEEFVDVAFNFMCMLTNINLDLSISTLATIISMVYGYNAKDVIKSIEDIISKMEVANNG